jgi:hypothetical protein
MVGGAKRLDRRQMLRTAVSTVPVPPIPLVPICQSAHQAVTHRLGDDPGRGDRVAIGVAVDKGVVRVADLGHPKAIDQQAGMRGSGEADERPSDGPVHGQCSRHANIQLINFPNRRTPDADAERRSPDLKREHFPSRR